MKLDSKTILSSLLGLIGAFVLMLLSNLINIASFSLKDMAIFLLLFIIVSIGFVFYKNIQEVDDKVKEIDERLKTHEKYINLEARIIALENKDGKER